jgi:hypothetical protein
MHGIAIGKGGRCQLRRIAIRLWLRAYVEHVIGSIRRECLDHVIVFGESSLRRTLSSYLSYCHQTRPHLSLDKDAPDPQPIQPPGARTSGCSTPSGRTAPPLRTTRSLNGSGPLQFAIYTTPHLIG